eukprot:2746475-Pleurochrysis_carterae.AAC.2
MVRRQGLGCFAPFGYDNNCIMEEALGISSESCGLELGTHESSNTKIALSSRLKMGINECNPRLAHAISLSHPQYIKRPKRIRLGGNVV